MPRGSKSKYTGKQKRMAEHIEKGYAKRGVSERESERRAWATVNKVTGGGRKSGSGSKRKSAAKSSARAAGKTGAASRKRKPAAKSAARSAGKAGAARKSKAKSKGNRSRK